MGGQCLFIDQLIDNRKLLQLMILRSGRPSSVITPREKRRSRDKFNEIPGDP